MRYLLFSILLFLLAGCSNKKYSSEKIGWKITLPANAWKVTVPKKGEIADAKTKQEVEEFVGVKIDGENVQPLISFTKDSSNSFVSVIEAYNYTTDTQYEQLLTEQHTKIKKNFASKETGVEYEIGATRIGGMMLDWFNMKIYYPGSEKPPHLKRIFSCIVNKYILSIIISASNDKNMERLEEVVYSSNFSIKHQSQ